MEAVILIGIQGAGKTTFYVERFLHTHVRLSLDLVRTRRRLERLISACIELRQPFVLDNTNASAAERAAAIALARAAGFRVAGYFFEPDIAGSLRRNEGRAGRQAVPKKGVFGTLKRLEPPVAEEGFDELFTVRVGEDHGFLAVPLESPT
jgi:predicted kinase